MTLMTQMTQISNPLFSAGRPNVLNVNYSKIQKKFKGRDFSKHEENRMPSIYRLVVK